MPYPSKSERGTLLFLASYSSYLGTPTLFSKFYKYRAYICSVAQFITNQVYWTHQTIEFPVKGTASKSPNQSNSRLSPLFHWPTVYSKEKYVEG